MKLEDDRYCFACGEKNRHGLGLKFTVDKAGTMHTEFIPQKHHQGFKDIMHGGLIGLIMDEVMVNLLWKLGKNSVTAELNIRLKKAAKVGEKLHFSGWVDKQEGRIIYTGAEARNATGSILATTGEKCIALKGA